MKRIREIEVRFIVLNLGRFLHFHLSIDSIAFSAFCTASRFRVNLRVARRYFQSAFDGLGEMN